MPDDSDAPPRRSRLKTPFYQPGESILIVDPSLPTRLAALHAALSLGINPIIVGFKDVPNSAAINRPLVIVIEELPESQLDILRDLAVATGSQLLRIRPSEPEVSIVDRTTIAVKAARAIHRS